MYPVWSVHQTPYTEFLLDSTICNLVEMCNALGTLEQEISARQMNKYKVRNDTSIYKWGHVGEIVLGSMTSA